ncbi:transposase [Nitrososphaera sp. AFS]|nr:transposase [Nitrososphaera sp. AFS]
MCFIKLVRFGELTDNQWNLLLPSIPPHAPTGKPRANDRNKVNGNLYVLMSGCRWMVCPQNTVLTKQLGKDI